MIAVRNGDSSHFDKVIDCTEKEIMGAIDKNLKSARDMKKIHYRVLLMLILSSGIQKMTLITEKRGENTNLLMNLWKKTSQKVNQLFNASIKIAQSNPILSEYIIKDILKNYKHSIQQIGLNFTDPKENLKKGLPDKIVDEEYEEEFKREEEPEEEKESES